MNKILIDTKKCIELAEYIGASGGVPEDREDPMPHSFPKRVAANGWCAIVAINQQTTPVVGQALAGEIDGRMLYGWDFLIQKAIYESQNNPEMFTAEWLCAVTEEQLSHIYGPTLSYPRIRAKLLNNLGRTLKKMGFASVEEIYKKSGGYIIRSDGGGIAQLLSRAKAYQDPVKKKLFYFLALMRNQGFWEYKDSINVSSPINYHEQRGHSRIGTVKITDAELERKIKDRENIDDQEDIEIRSTVLRAVEFIAQYLSITPSMMHYYFWNHFRNCCSQNNPHCRGCPENCKLPARYRTVQRCVFANVCQSASLPVSQMLIQPRIDTTIWQ